MPARIGAPLAPGTTDTGGGPGVLAARCVVRTLWGAGGSTASVPGYESCRRATI